jgi:hypothetical protein
MKQNALMQPSVLISRRTGIDRRWIPSEGHQPERRRGGDRRTDRKRALDQQLIADDETHQQDPEGARDLPSKQGPLNQLPSPRIDAWEARQFVADTTKNTANDS